MKKTHAAGLVVVALAATTVVAVKLLTTDRQRVARVVRRLVGRVERRDAPGFCLLLAEDYTDSTLGNRAAVRSFLAAVALRVGSIDVSLEDLQIEVTGTAATAEFLAHAVVHLRDHGREPPYRWKSRVRLRLRKADGVWLVHEAEYSLPPRARGVDF